MMPSGDSRPSSQGLQSHLNALPARPAALYRGTPVLVTGGMGFIGSTLARRLHGMGARVAVLDSLNPGQGGNPANLEDIQEDLEIVIGDQADAALVAGLVASATDTEDGVRMRHGGIDVTLLGHSAAAASAAWFVGGERRGGGGGPPPAPPPPARGRCTAPSCGRAGAPGGAPARRRGPG